MSSTAGGMCRRVCDADRYGRHAVRTVDDSGGRFSRAAHRVHRRLADGSDRFRKSRRPVHGRSDVSWPLAFDADRLVHHRHGELPDRTSRSRTRAAHPPASFCTVPVTASCRTPTPVSATSTSRPARSVAVGATTASRRTRASNGGSRSPVGARRSKRASTQYGPRSEPRRPSTTRASAAATSTTARA